ncbi:short chain dehydrogenase/reductase family protein [Aspergillus fumigatus Af293]|uniref:Short chain dehydrogenase/reductase family protein n=2 Tax=Aspergillus fumigatus TaxID=746128 RepID=Q4WDB2_ASPFU|nr:short chain dehydrogenase/reductase family protein [Aspergillus fumigatus Af293]EAL85626.1 short chain dehydrogenase/reductase family protein [Aspergillus fumigatus Af293]EDP47572.1 short chain dehydrogenase/reductase family protein [Aspergillus fumigatus A1163]
MTDNPPPPDYSRPQFPAHSEPRVWLITAGDSPIGISVTRQVLKHGDYALVGLAHTYLDLDECRREAFGEFLAEVESHRGEGWVERFKTVPLDIRMIGQCQALVAEAVAAFGKVDILLCCTSQTLVGAVEELAASQQTLNLVKDQFETNYFGPLNIIKATLPHMRKQKSGHIMILSSITAHIGTPGLGMYSAAGWALEGFCDVKPCIRNRPIQREAHNLPMQHRNWYPDKLGHQCASHSSSVLSCCQSCPFVPWYIEQTGYSPAPPTDSGHGERSPKLKSSQLC